RCFSGVLSLLIRESPWNWYLAQWLDLFFNCTELNREHFQVVVLILRSEFKHCNLRPGPEPDGKAGRADAAIDVKFRASVFVPSAGVAIQQTTEVEAAVDGLQRQLSAMRDRKSTRLNSS